MVWALYDSARAWGVSLPATGWGSGRTGIVAGGAAAAATSGVLGEEGELLL